LSKPGKQTLRISRREFARGGALAAASAALPAALLPEAAAQTPNDHPALSTASQEEVNAKVATILRKYGQLLSDAEKLDVRRLLTEGQATLDQMRESALKLGNSDQPGNVLKLYPDAAPPAAPLPKGAKK
jgi:hypothetical protein